MESKVKVIINGIDFNFSVTPTTKYQSNTMGLTVHATLPEGVPFNEAVVEVSQKAIKAVYAIMANEKNPTFRATVDNYDSVGNQYLKFLASEEGEEG